MHMNAFAKPFLGRKLNCSKLATLLVASAFAQAQAEDLPVFELEELEVRHLEENFDPVYTKEAPTFSFFESPQLPRGQIILALEFMDQYRESRIPGSVKWAGILHFPLINSNEQPLLKWLCLYFYNDRMFGYDPAPRYESERRFAIPIRFEDRTNQAVLTIFAENYVLSIYPGGEESYLVEAVSADPEEPGMVDEYEYYDVPAGRIEAVLSSDRGKPASQLVKLIYQYNGEADPVAVAAIGPPPAVEDPPFSWKNFWASLSYTPDHLETARSLLQPRWAQRAILHHVRDRLFLADKPSQQEVLLFNIGMRIFAYNPDYGVWRTEATVQELSDEALLLSKIRYPGIQSVERIEFLPVANVDAP